MEAAVAQVQTVDVLADLAHEMRQPLSTLEALASYLDLIVPDDVRIREQLRKMHVEIARADQVLVDSLHAMQAHLASVGSTASRRSAHEEAVDEISRSRTRSAIGVVAH